MSLPIRSIAHRLASPPLRASLRRLLVESRLALASRRGDAALASLRTRTRMRLHLGCGHDLRPGWVNIDLSLSEPAKVAGAEFINHDLRTGLPLAANTAEIIYSSHFLEHLEPPYFDGLMRDCYRVLEPGGRFRAALPNFAATYRAYLDNNGQYFDALTEDVRAAIPLAERTLIDFVNYAAYQFGEHKLILDEEKIIAVLRHIGYTQADVSFYQPDVD